MAKVTGPAHSFDASGRLGGMVFIKGGFLRQHVSPSNPRTPAQQNVRQSLSAAGAFIRVTGTLTRDEIKDANSLMRGKPTNQWPGLLGQKLISDLPNIRTDFAGLASTADWETEGDNAGLEEILLPNATDPAISAGLQLFLGANALFDLGIYTANGAPDATNAAAWAASIIS
jgi:hypothetical protein